MLIVLAVDAFYFPKLKDYNMSKFLGLSLSCVLSTGLLAGAAYADDDTRNYEVTVTNITRGQSFTPILVATHHQGIHMYQFGQPASSALAALAEGGETAPLAAVFGATPHAKTMTSAGLLAPGKSVTITISARDGADHISVASMLIPTNDTFIAVNGMPLPKGKEASVFLSSGHDSGSEPNDEMCAHMPGPVCHGEGTSAHAGGEGFVHISAGIHGIGDLEAAEYDWRNSVARIVVRKIQD